MSERNEKQKNDELSLKDPKILRELEKSAESAKSFSDKFVKARILDETVLHRHVTI